MVFIFTGIFELTVSPWCSGAASSSTGSIKARFENIAKQKEEEDRRRAEEERARRQAKEQQEQEEARRKAERPASPVHAPSPTPPAQPEEEYQVGSGSTWTGCGPASRTMSRSLTSFFLVSLLEQSGSSERSC